MSLLENHYEEQFIKNTALIIKFAVINYTFTHQYHKLHMLLETEH